MKLLTTARKAGTGALIAAAAAVTAASPDGFTKAELGVILAAAVAGAVGVFYTPNKSA